MLCTNCSQPIRPIVALDIDGTLGDYHAHFIGFAEQYLGIKLPWDYDGVDEFSDSLCLEKNLYREIKLAYRQGGMKRSMPIFSGAEYFVRTLRNAGVEVWLTTTRPYLRYDRVDPDTRAWLERHQIQYDGLVYDEGKYERLIEIVDSKRVIAVVEDVSELFDRAESLELHPIYRWTRWNSGTPRQPGASTFDAALNLILPRIEEWRKKNGRPKQPEPSNSSGVSV